MWRVCKGDKGGMGQGVQGSSIPYAGWTAAAAAAVHNTKSFFVAKAVPTSKVCPHLEQYSVFARGIDGRGFL